MFKRLEELSAEVVAAAGIPEIVRTYASNFCDVDHAEGRDLKFANGIQKCIAKFNTDSPENTKLELLQNVWAVYCDGAIFEEKAKILRGLRSPAGEFSEKLTHLFSYADKKLMTADGHPEHARPWTFLAIVANAIADKADLEPVKSLDEIKLVLPTHGTGLYGGMVATISRAAGEPAPPPPGYDRL